MRQCVIGIDGGGTKTHLLCVDREGDILAEVYGGSSNLCSNSEERVRQYLEVLISDMRLALNEEVEIISICLGTAGLIAERSHERLTEILRELFGNIAIQIVGDMETALVANMDHEAGVLVISGTGAIAYGMDLNQETYRSGGWGHLVGDEGSAYWIASQGLRRALKSFDGRGQLTDLYKAFKSYLNCQNHSELVAMIYSPMFNKSKMADLARVVGEVALEGDQIAIQILQEAGIELAHLGASVIRKLTLDDLAQFKVITAGSVLLNNEFVQDSFREALLKLYPQSNIIPIQKSAAYGAVKLAIKAIAKER